MISALEALTSEISGLNMPINKEKMLDWQFEKIRLAIRRAVSKNSFYAQRFRHIDISKINSKAAMSAIPFTNACELAEYPKMFICDDAKNISRTISIMTSGSSAVPKRIFFTDNDLMRTVRLFELGMAPIIGKNGKRVVVMMSGDTENSIADLLKKGVTRLGIPAVIYGHIHDAEKAACFLQDGDTIVGVPVEIIYLCRKYPNLRPESVLLSADYVPEPVVLAVRNTWGCRVYTHYGMTETCFGFAVQCSESSYQHIRHDCLYVEIINPKTGEQVYGDTEGEIVVTAFLNEAMPLFRYKTEDISRLVYEKCECGSTLPRLASVKGRLKNIIKLSEDIVISTEQLDDMIYSDSYVLGCIGEFFVSENPKRLNLKIAANDGFNAQKLASAIKNRTFGLVDVVISRENCSFIKPSQTTKGRIAIVT